MFAAAMEISPVSAPQNLNLFCVALYFVSKGLSLDFK